jgi:hypothetical protein
MPEFVGDAMAEKFLAMYGSSHVGDGYRRWCAEQGDDWVEIVAFIESETGLPFADGWSVYWAVDYEGIGDLFRLLTESGDTYITESGDYLRTE